MKPLGIGVLIRIATLAIVKVLERKGIMTLEEYEKERDFLIAKVKKEED